MIMAWKYLKKLYNYASEIESSENGTALHVYKTGTNFKDED